MKQLILKLIILILIFFCSVGIVGLSFAIYGSSDPLFSKEFFVDWRRYSETVLKLSYIPAALSVIILEFIAKKPFVILYGLCGSLAGILALFYLSSGIGGGDGLAVLFFALFGAIGGFSFGLFRYLALGRREKSVPTT